MGLPGPHARSRVHPPHRRRPLLRRLHGELGVQCFSRHSGPHLRPPLRARLPPRPRRRRKPAQTGTGRHLPPEAGSGRLQGPGHQAGDAAPCQEKERQENRLRRRRPGLAHRRSRFGPLGLRRHGVRPGPARGRHDLVADPALPLAAGSDRRGGRLHPRPRRALQAAQDRQHESAAHRGLGRDLRRLRRPARPRPRHPRPQGSRGEHPHRHRLAVVGVLRAHDQDRQARHRPRRRQHCHGLLPHLAAPGRR